MKRSARILCLLLALCLSAGLLTGCGGKAPEAQTPETVWTPEFYPMPKGTGYINCACFSGDTLYAGGMSGDAEMSGTDGVSAYFTLSADETGAVAGPVIYRMASDGSACDTLPEYSFMTLPEGAAGQGGIDRICAAADGTLWSFESVYCYHYQLPDGFTGSGADKEKYYVDDGMRCALRHLSADGAVLAEADLSEAMDGSPYFYSNGLACDDDGNVYIAADQTLWCFDSDGAGLFSLDMGSYLTGLGRSSDGTVFAAGYSSDYSSMDIRAVDSRKQSFSQLVSLPADISGVYDGAGDSFFLYSTGSALYSYDHDSGGQTRLLDWLDCDIDQNSLRAVAVTGGGSVLCADYSPSSGEGETALISQRAASASEKTVLTLATLSVSSQLTQQVLKFNKRSDAYRITVKDYSQYDSADSQTAGLTKLNTELMAGTYPDILDVSQLPLEQYVSRGMLVDMYPYLDADKELSRDSFVPAIQKALETDGGLYRAVSSFGVLTVIGGSKVVGDEMGWSFADMQACLDTMPEGAELFQYGVSRDALLRIMCFTYMDTLVDWGTGKCNFDSEDFRDILKMCGLYTNDADTSQDNYESEGSRISSGKQMLEFTIISSFSDCQMYSAMFGGDITYKGFPVSQGVGSFAYIDSGLAITSKCTDMDGAWSFVRGFLTADYQEGDSVWSFPTNQKAFDSKLEQAMKKTYVTDENGEQVEESTGSIGWDDFTVDLYAMTQEQADDVTALINSVSGAIVYDDNISDIVISATAGYFAGDLSLDDAVKNVQSRVSLYVNEQR